MYLKGTSIHLTGIGWARNIIAVSFMHWCYCKWNAFCSLNRRSRKEDVKKVFVAKIQQLELVQMFPGDFRMCTENWKLKHVSYASIHDLNTSFIRIVFPSVTYNLQPFDVYGFKYKNVTDNFYSFIAKSKNLTVAVLPVIACYVPS